MSEWLLLEGVRKSFGRLEVLRGIDLAVSPGEVCCLLGPSGSGKSTLLRCVNHLEKVDRGQIWVDGDLVGYRRAGRKLHELSEREISRQRAEIGMVFQRFNLFPHMTALANVADPPRVVLGLSKAEARERAVKEGRMRSEPVYFGGADNDEPSEDEVQDPPPCGYELSKEQRAQVKLTMALLGIAARGTYVPMSQESEPVIALLLDERAERHSVAAEPDMEC